MTFGSVTKLLQRLALVIALSGAYGIAVAARAAEPAPAVRQLPSTAITGKQSGPVAGAPVNGTSPPGLTLGHGPIITGPINQGPGKGIIICCATVISPFPHLVGQPDNAASPYALQIVSTPAIVNSAAFNANNLLVVHNPAVWFSFPVTPNQSAWWANGDQARYKAIGFTGTVAIEACLSADEVKNWSGAVEMATDLTTCPQLVDLVNDGSFIDRAWYQVASASADLYVVQNGGFVNGDSIVAQPVLLAVSLQQALVPMRFHVTNGAEYFYANNHTGPNNYNDACPPGSFTGVCLNYVAPVDFPNGGSFYTAPFNVVTLPTAMIQLKVVPRTVLYVPPGNDSTTCSKRTQTFTTTVTAGATMAVDNSDSQDNWMDAAAQQSTNATIAKVLSFGYSEAGDTRWDTKTTLKTGQALEHDVQGQNQTLTWQTYAINAGKSAVPGAAGTLQNEPFWDDEVLVLVHPQLAVWDFSGRQSMQFVAASAGSNVPDEIPITISELDACANGAAPYVNGYGFTTATGQPETLNAAECKMLASLDPFYGTGQSASLTSRGQLIYPAATYGVSPVSAGEGSDHAISIGQTTSNAVTSTDANTTTYTSTVEDIVATTWSQGVTFGGTLTQSIFNIGLNNQVTLKQGSSIDTSQTMTLTYKDSTAVTYRSDVTDDGTIDDTVNRGYAPRVEIYQDSLFGSYMFRDPDAVCSPMPACQASAPAGPATAKLVPQQPGKPSQTVAPQPPVVIKTIQTCTSSG